MMHPIRSRPRGIGMVQPLPDTLAAFYARSYPADGATITAIDADGTFTVICLDPDTGLVDRATVRAGEIGTIAVSALMGRVQQQFVRTADPEPLARFIVARGPFLANPSASTWNAYALAFDAILRSAGVAPRTPTSTRLGALAAAALLFGGGYYLYRQVRS